jgi:phage-related protein
MKAVQAVSFRHSGTDADRRSGGDVECGERQSRGDKLVQTAPNLTPLANMPTDLFMAPKTLRIVSWIKSARKDFGDFPKGAQDKAFEALSVIADGSMPDVAKPLTGLGSGVWELAIKERGDAYRLVYALQLGEDIWVVHAFQKKSTKGIATPKHEIDLVRDRIKRLKEMLK